LSLLHLLRCSSRSFYSINPPPPYLHPLSLHDALPISQALLRGLDILITIGIAAGPLRFGDIEKIVRLPRASLHRLLAALTSRDLVRYDSRKRTYEVGARVLELSRRTLDRSLTIRDAKP